MSYGLSVQSSLGTIQVDENYVGVRLIQSGSLTADSTRIATLTLGQPFSAPPLVLVRPTAFGRYVGGMFFLGPYAGQSNDSIRFLGTASVPFDYAIFAIEGTAVDDGSTYGLRVWNPSNQITFNSAHTRARITHTFSIGSFARCQSSAASYSISGYSSMPWVVANNLYSVWSNGEEFVYEGFVVGFDSYSTMRMGYSSWSTSNWPNLGTGCSGNAPAPYPFTLAVAKINEGA